jgi:two-component system NtrC family response regulator
MMRENEMDSNKTILIVDEDQQYTEMLTAGFQNAKYRICVKNSCNFRSDSLDGLCPNFAIIDMYLPTTRGMEFCKSLSKQFPDIQILLMTHEETLDLNMELMRGYVYGFLVKPFKFIQAYAAIYRAEKDFDLVAKYRQQSSMIEKLKQENNYLKKSRQVKSGSESPPPATPPVTGVPSYNHEKVIRDNG